MTCSVAGNVTLAVPAGTTDVDVDAVGGGGGAGYPARAHVGGNAAEVSGNLTLPAGTAYLYVIVGAGGSGDNHGSGIGGGASAVFAEDSGHGLLAKLVVAGAGGSGSYNGDGGNAGSAGTSENTSLSAAGSAGIGAMGGAGGAGNYATGGAGGSDSYGALTVAAGGNGGGVPGGAYGGGGGGGYGGGGGGGGGTSGVLTRNVAAGGGGSSLASAYLGSAAISIASGTGGVQLPGLVAGDGATGTVTMTFDGLAVPGAPTAVSATPGDGRASVSFTAPSDDGGSPITSYTVTSSPGGRTATCPGSPCVLTGLTDGTAYTFTAHATNANGDSPESSASDQVTPAIPPDAPTGVSATAGAGQVSVSFTAPAQDGGASITSYTVTASPGGHTATCPGSPCALTGLHNGTAYTVTVHATNNVGDSPESATSAPATPVSAPAAPTGVSAQPGHGQAGVSFSAPVEDGGLPITAYTVTADPGGATATCPGSPCTITGLTDGTSYTFTVHATNSEGDSPESGPSAAVTPAWTPGAPTGASATAGDGQASVSFSAPAADGGSSITSYTVTASPGGATATCPASPCVVTGLTNGTAYTFTVHATNDIGDSPESGASTSVTPVGAPGEPTGVTYTASDQQIGVALPVPADGGSAITGYQYSTDGGLTWSTLPVTVGSHVSGSITGLTNGTTYAVQIRAVNANGPGDASSAQHVTPAAVPAAPTGVVAQRGDHSASVSFTVPADGGSSITSYTVTAAPGSRTATCSDSPCVIAGLSNGISYTFTVHATNGQGDSAESAASAAITPAAVPDAPAAVHVTPGDRSARISFSAPDSGGSPVTGYQYSTDGGLTWHALTTSGSTSLSGTVTGLTDGTAYAVQVRAANSVGTGPASASVSVVPARAAQAPTDVTATAGTGNATVSFRAPADDGGAPVTSYTVTAVPGGAHVTCTSSPCTVAGLAGGTSYTFTVHASNSAGSSSESAASNPVAVTDVPSAPSSVRVVAGDRSLTVSFAVPHANGSTIATYQYSLDHGRSWHQLRVSIRASRATGVIRGLRDGVRYPLQLRATNAQGAGNASATSSVTPVAPAPAAPHRSTTPRWYHDPLTRTQRSHLAAITTNPAHTHGRTRLTRAAYRTHNGTLAVPASRAAGHQLVKGEAVQITGLFAFNSTRINSAGRRKLHELAKSLKHAHAITCEGYADYAGERKHERTLSQRRARNVCHLLAAAGVRIHWVGYGRRRPVVIGGSAPHRIANRRVDVIVTR